MESLIIIDFQFVQFVVSWIDRGGGGGGGYLDQTKYKKLTLNPFYS